jgi:hypothetical protein
LPETRPHKSYADKCCDHIDAAYGNIDKCAASTFKFISCNCTADNINATSTFVIALATIAIVVTAVYQYRAFSGQLTEMQNAYVPLKDSADAAKSAADTSRAIMLAKERASLIAQNMLVVRWSDAPKVTVGVRLKNAGQSIAYIIRATLVFQSIPDPSDVPNSASCGPDAEILSDRRVLPIGNETQIDIRNESTGVIPASFPNAWGVIEYEDEFTRQKLAQTRIEPFCFVFERTATEPIDNVGHPFKGACRRTFECK